MKIPFDCARLLRWCIVLPAVAAPVASACFLDTSGIGGGGGGMGGMVSSSTATTPSTSGGMDGGGDGNLCGNGVIDQGEECDGTNLNMQTCMTLGYGGGTLTCGPTCKFVTTGCPFPSNWYNPSGWTHRRPVTIHYMQVVDDLTNFPVALIVNDASLLSQIRANGADVLITDFTGKNKLNHEIELVDVNNPNKGTLVLWVQVPMLSKSSDTTLYLYYANPSCPDQQSATKVWDANDQMVVHLGEPTMDGGTSDGGTFPDSTGNSHDGTPQGTITATGQIGNAQMFNGMTPFIEVANPGGVTIGTAGCTIAAWINTSTVSLATIVAKAQMTMNTAGDKILAVAGPVASFASYNLFEGFGTHTVTDGKWHHVVWTQTPTMGMMTQWDLYVDGNHDGPWFVMPNADPMSFNLRIGAQVGTFGYFSGTIDEVRIANTPRSTAWIQTSFNNQSNQGNLPAPFYTIGPAFP